MSLIYGGYAQKNITTGWGNVNVYENPDRPLFVIRATEVVNIFFLEILCLTFYAM